LWVFRPNNIVALSVAQSIAGAGLYSAISALFVGAGTASTINGVPVAGF
jgi:hypothetical protein